MFTFALGIVVGIFIPVEYNVMVKDKIFAVWDWIKSGPKV